MPFDFGSRSEQQESDKASKKTNETTDWYSDEHISRDPEFEKKFTRLARDLGRARELDLDRTSDPWKYFSLTAENQRKFYDVDPQEFMRRAINREEVTRTELMAKYGFEEDLIPPSTN